jgi:hypothetical protein
LIIGSKPLKFLKPECKGTPPSPRILHTMNYYEEGNFLIIYGGKNDFTERSDFNDIFLLELSKLEWLEIKVFSSEPITVMSRFGHSSFIDVNKLIIFGGMNNNNFIGSALFIIDLGIYLFN